MIVYRKINAGPTRDKREFLFCSARIRVVRADKKAARAELVVVLGDKLGRRSALDLSIISISSTDRYYEVVHDCQVVPVVTR